MLFEPKMVVLRDERTTTDRRFLSARYKRNSDLVFEGQDLGEGVMAFWGSREYEWTWTVKATDIPRLLAALNIRRNLLSEIKRRFSGSKASEIEPFLKEKVVPYLFWSRVGD